MKKKRINLNFPENQLEEIEIIAKSQGIPLSEIIRRAVDLYRYEFWLREKRISEAKDYLIKGAKDE